jgi:leucyl-tRNA synthetase
MSDVSLREGVMISHFEMLSDWNWYLRRGGRDKSTARSFLEGWIPMLAPATPHVAEEFWDKLGGDGLLAKFVLPDLEEKQDDLVVTAVEDYIKEIISSGRNLRTLAERHSEKEISKVVIQTSPSWKSELALEAIRLQDQGFDFKKEGQAHVKSLEIFNNEKIRGEVFQTWSAITTGSKNRRGRIHTWSDGEKKILSQTFNETGVISANSDFIANALEVDYLEVYQVGEGADIGGKAKISFPLEPGIAFE